MTQQHDGPSLLPCPFCGSAPARDFGRYTNASFSGVEVMDPTNGPYVWCGTCCVRTATCDSQAEAIAAWNARPPQAEGLDRRIEKQIWKAEANFDDNLKAVLEECRAALRSHEPSEEMVERMTRAIAEAQKPELFCGDPEREHRAASPYLVDHAKGVALAEAEISARSALSSLSLPDR